jgi:hypothetical protein
VHIQQEGMYEDIRFLPTYVSTHTLKTSIASGSVPLLSDRSSFALLSRSQLKQMLAAGSCSMCIRIGRHEDEDEIDTERGAAGR